jgi:APA family basic amino acid/polyamine antiporter
MKLYPLLPLIFIAAYIFVGISIWVNTPELAWTGLAVFAAFLVIYFLVMGVNKRDIQRDDSLKDDRNNPKNIS